MSDAGDGQVIPADPDALEAAFTDEAAALARQILVTATLPTRSRQRGHGHRHRADRRHDATADTYAVIRARTPARPWPQRQTTSVDISRR